MERPRAKLVFVEVDLLLAVLVGPGYRVWLFVTKGKQCRVQRRTEIEYSDLRFLQMLSS